VGGLTEAYLSHWSARGDDGRVSFTQVGVLPLLRYRFDQGRSPWFIEGGIGLSAMDRVYRTRSKEFSTTFNFVDVAGVGRSFGERRSQELSLRISHVSNAGIKHPNPGENLLQLRYARMF
jgi:lipid A 3-O-deacylase